MSSNPVRRRRLALLLPAHNEELILAATINSALAAGQKLEDIYLVDDNSTDRTAIVAHRFLPISNVLSVGRSGKALAVQKAIKYFDLEKRYVWLHVADADSVFGADYFRIYKKSLNARKYSVAVGFVQSLRGNWIAKYRAFSYTYGQHIFRRLQSWLGMITVFPGPITTFKTDIIKDLEFVSDSPTEDFDLTLQVHRKHLGAIKFIPRAVNYTQDPQSLKDFIKQNQRWQRGFFQGVIKYRIGSKLERIDFSII
jgi:cellulose synthase/poly-beta-1,6-N-acetylglucosamine synthase-like glycosyltransferase